MRLPIAIALALFALPAVAAPIPTFEDPRALLVAIYDQIAAYEDWDNFDADAAFEETDSFSSRLGALYEEANAALKATGEEIGVLDFSPFINGQDSGGMTFDVGQPKVKGDRATAVVDIGGYSPRQIGFELVDEGADGWKIDDIVLPGHEGAPSWRLSEYFIDPNF